MTDDDADPADSDDPRRRAREALDDADPGEVEDIAVTDRLWKRPSWVRRWVTKRPKASG